MSGFPNIGEDFGGRYHLERELGRGGMGVVYAARDLTLQREVALKILHPMLATDDEYRERFAREAATLARMDSPMIVAIFDYGERDGSLFLVTQLVTQGDLHAWLRAHGPLDTETALAVTHDLCEALADAHQAGVVHRDVKPSNVFLRTRKGRLHALLGDFGIATSEDAHVTKTGTVVGSTAYMAPERHRGARADERADIYSVGCVLWMALTGKAPYTGTDMQVAMAHMSNPVPQLADGRPLQAEINEVVRRSLAKDPSGRYTNVADLGQAIAGLQHAVRDRPQVPTPVPKPVTGSDTPSGRHTPVPTPGSSPPGEPEETGATVLRPQDVAVAAAPAGRRSLPMILGGVVALVVVVAVILFLVFRPSGTPVAGTGATFKKGLYDGLARTNNGWELGTADARCVGNKFLGSFGEQQLKSKGVVDSQGLIELDPHLDQADANSYANAFIDCGATARWAWAGYLHADGKSFDGAEGEHCVQNALVPEEARTWIAAYLTDTTPSGYEHTGNVVKGCVDQATS